MFEATLREASLLKRVLDSIRELVTEANFDCQPEGISLQAMDTSHVALVSLFLNSEGFEMYRCDHNISLGINLASLTKILKCANNDDKLKIRADEGNLATATFIFESPDGTRMSQFTLKLMDINQQRLGIPQTEYKASVRLSSAEFQRISRDMGVIGETVGVGVKKDEVHFTVTGDIGDGEICLKQGGSADGGSETVVECSEPVSSTFALKYFVFFSKATALSDTVIIQMNPDVPISIQYRMNDNAGYIRYYLAPKIDDDAGDDDGATGDM